jgi:hypothetical protein
MNTELIELYFNTRIEILNDDIRELQIPLYPSKSPEKDNFSVLIECLRSYQVLKFNNVIFNIELVGGRPEHWDTLLQEINFLDYKNIVLNRTRPSSLKDWINNLDSIKKYFAKNVPLMVVMNHDHLFVDYTIKPLQFILNNINFYDNHVFYYSHQPEINSWILNGRGVTKFNFDKKLFICSNTVDYWIESIIFTTLQTLLNIFNKIKCSSDAYLPRIDWPNITYNPLGLKLLTFPRELFRHYDGYGHITSLRFVLDCSYNFNNASIEQKYYILFLHNYIIALKKMCEVDGYDYENLKINFLKCFDLFCYGYINFDLNIGLLNNYQSNSIKNYILKMFMFELASIISLIKIDIEIFPTSNGYEIRQRLRNVTKLINFCS